MAIRLKSAAAQRTTALLGLTGVIDHLRLEGSSARFGVVSHLPFSKSYRLRSAPSPSLVRTDHILVVAERLALEDPGVEIQRPGRLDGEVRISGEDPHAMPPRADRVGVEDPPHRGRRDRLHEPPFNKLIRQLRAAPARQRNAARCGQLAGQRLHLGHLQRGKRTGADPVSCGPPDHQCLPRRSAYAT